MGCIIVDVGEQKDTHGTRKRRILPNFMAPSSSNVDTIKKISDIIATDIIAPAIVEACKTASDMVSGDLSVSNVIDVEYNEVEHEKAAEDKSADKESDISNDTNGKPAKKSKKNKNNLSSGKENDSKGSNGKGNKSPSTPEAVEVANNIIGFNVNKFVRQPTDHVNPALPHKASSPIQIQQTKPIPTPMSVPIPDVQEEMLKHSSMPGVPLEAKRDALRNIIKYIPNKHVGENGFGPEEIESLLSFFNGKYFNTMMKKYKANVKNKGPYVYEIPINKYPTETPDTCNIAFEVPIKGDQSRKIVIRFNTHPVFNVGLGAYTNDTRIYTANVPNSTNGANKKG